MMKTLFLLAESDPGTGGSGGKGGPIDFDALCKAFPPGSLLCGSDVTIGKLVSRGLNYAFAIAGLVLLFVILSSGFQMMIGAADPKAKEAASKNLTNGVIGFLIVFTSYWLVFLIKKVLGME